MVLSKVLRRVLAAAGLLLAVASQAEASRFYCLKVDARQGWQRLDVPRVMIKDWQTQGGWSVDMANYMAVGPRGHVGAAAKALAPHNQFKYEPSAPFGAMLVRVRNRGKVMDMVEFSKLVLAARERGKPFDAGWLEFRINDSDNALGDNAGAINICLLGEG